MEVATPREAERSEECMNLSPGLSGIMAESLDFAEKKFVWQAGRMVFIIQVGRRCTGFSSEIGTKLRDWAAGQA